MWTDEVGVAPIFDNLLQYVSGVSNGMSARLRLSATGTVNIQTGETYVYGNHVSLEFLQEEDGDNVPKTDSRFVAIQNLFAKAKVEGYDLISYRTNLNRRQRGQLIDTTYQTQLYNVPLRGPITALHPVTSDGTTDASDLSSLITATHIRTSNAAVRELIRVADMLEEYVSVKDHVGVGPDILGVGRYLIIPTFMRAEIDYLRDIDSLKSHERAEDLQAVLVNKLRDMAYNMYVSSQYMAAADAIAGGVARPPEVILGTDPVIARYLQVAGDLRTLGGEFNVRIVSTLNRDVRGKIYMAFGQFGEGETDGPNPLHFGTMAWKPELTVTLPISRSGQISKELTVQPSFLHFVNCPIMGVLEVKNIASALSKVTLNTKVL
jgi:hypothetical protein